MAFKQFFKQLLYTTHINSHHVLLMNPYRIGYSPLQGPGNSNNCTRELQSNSLQSPLDLVIIFKQLEVHKPSSRIEHAYYSNADRNCQHNYIHASKQNPPIHISDKIRKVSFFAATLLPKWLLFT